MTKPQDIYATYTQDEESGGDLQPEMMLSGKYRLIKQIGKGAMGVVWQAHERIADRLVALKFVPKECNHFKDELERMKKSFSKIHALNHQSICPIYSLEDDGDFGYFLVMKFLEGETLDDYRLRKDPKRNGLPLDQVLELVMPVAQALDYAHHHDVIHRDVKPSNIFLSETGKGVNVEIIDFGLADEIREGMSRVSKVTFDTSGSPAYMAPEQWKGHRQTAETDQYALAVIVYEFLAGHLPFSGSNIENAVLKYDPEPIKELSEEANAALQKALAKKGEERFASCQEFIVAFGGEKREPATVSPDAKQENEAERIERDCRERAERTRKKQEQIEQEHRRIKDLYYSTGMRFLEERQHDEALNAFEMAMEHNTDNSDTFFYAAICRLQGKKAFLAQRHEIEAIEKDIKTALKIEPRGIYYYFLAYIKYDYFERKSFNTMPTYRELLSLAMTYEVSPLEIEQLFDILGVPRPDVL